MEDLLAQYPDTGARYPESMAKMVGK